MAKNIIMLLRFAAASEATGRPRTSFYRAIKAGLLPPPIKIGEASAWPSNEIEIINKAFIAGKSELEIKQLVSDLVAARAHAA
ncbi:helix-turn-helix transcriptional regulator [Methylomonas methanica]|uniref:Prophage CP4-57 regulatory n=1 Tax=Methylomonas methanica (strain DSM 25384 / MC09) TaxID=857087 RepID=G0A3U2_METMM|nr:AlpA family phage regulatory protein [Methylomonas methanica]AEG02714.1 Prophage CP4-57 regulatory [Methylomonas methanica MC09]